MLAPLSRGEGSYQHTPGISWIAYYANKAGQYRPKTHAATAFIFPSVFSAALENPVESPDYVAFTTSKNNHMKTIPLKATLRFSKQL